MNKNNKNIPIKNYIYALLLFIFTILFIVYIFMWVNVKQEEKYLNSFLINTNTVKYIFNDIEEINNAILESPSSFILFTGYTKDKTMYKIEKEIKKIIDEHNIIDNFYYLDVTDNTNDIQFINSFNKNFDTNVSSFPIILYFEDHKASKLFKLDKNIDKNLKTFNNFVSRKFYKDD